MGANYFTPWVDGTTKFRAAHMNAVPESLDSVASIAAKRPIVSCDGDVTWYNGTLTWAGTVRIVFNNSDGDAVLNTIAASSLAISDNEFAYVTLNETTGTILTMSKAAVSTGAASNFLSKLIMVLAYRNATSDEIVPVWLPIPQRNGIPQTTIVPYAATISVDLDAYNVADVTLTGDPTINFTGGEDGQIVVLRLRQDGTGTRVVTWGAMVRFSTDTPEPTLSTAAGALDYLVFRHNAIDVSTGSYDFMAANRGF